MILTAAMQIFLIITSIISRGSDNEWLFRASEFYRDVAIISVSFGATRSFGIRKKYSMKAQSFPLHDGDVSTMEGEYPNTKYQITRYPSARHSSTKYQSARYPSPTYQSTKYQTASHPIGITEIPLKGQ